MSKAQRDLSAGMHTCGAVKGDVLIVRANKAPAAPAGVQVWALGSAKVVKLTPQWLHERGWVRAK